MGLEPLKSLVEFGKIVSFYLSSENTKEHGLYTCQISSSDEEHFCLRQYS